MSFDLHKDNNDEEYEYIVPKLTPNRFLAEKLYNLYREMGNTSDKKKLIDIIVRSYVLERAPFSDAVVKLVPVLDAMEKLKSADLLSEAVNIAGYFLMLQEELQNRKTNITNKNQTLSAIREKQNKAIDRCLALEEFLREAEYAWHPQADRDQKIRNPQITQEKAIKKVFKAHKEEIVEELRKHGFENDFERVFGDTFKYYTEVYRKYNGGKTYSGYVLEKRASRSEESRKKSSLGAKKRIANRKSEIKNNTSSSN